MGTRWIGLVAMGVALAVASGARAQHCDDFDSCTKNDMCSDGMCSGTFQPGGSCDDFDDCTTNDRCQMDPELGPTCKGDPGTVGTPCGGGCGTCTSLSPIPIPGLPLTCSGDLADNGKTCDPGLGLGNCLQGQCLISGVAGFTIAFCLPAAKQCPDAGNCKGACNPNTGECDNSATRCFGACERCDNNTCVPANQGQGCDDFNECTPQSRCEMLEIAGQQRGLCMAGAPSGDTPTPTVTPVETPVAGECVGDCNNDLIVAINELISGVNIALGNAAISTCPSFDANGDGTVAINELILGVTRAQNGCAA